MLGSALAPGFVTEGRSLILAGKPGRGQTHLAIAVAHRAIQNDDDLAQAIIDGVLERGRLLRPDGPSVRTLHVNLDEAITAESDLQPDLGAILALSWISKLTTSDRRCSAAEAVRERALPLGDGDEGDDRAAEDLAITAW